ncbi:MAG TPA: bifunctional proline dehydrogenase/L-glutamate gamma-semialdehyde dehydrogenase, partial [Parachlamydiaceae bacterium]|nr:bifunctional proline dehydrogenase/L-glutamate gamma-semialdehyde dehydrogenase [Parachlamydiaceae bacterium]
MKNLNYMEQARQILDAAKGQAFSPEMRRKVAIELAAIMLEESLRIQTPKEKREKKLLARMMNDPLGKAFSTFMADQCFRSNNNSRVADQLVYLINQFGIPSFLTPFNKFQLLIFKYLGKPFSAVTIPLVKRMLRKQMSSVILPGEPKLLSRHMEKRRRDGVRINLNHLGEAILGENEAERRLNMYLNDLANPEVEYISIKISTIFSQISLLGWEDTLNILSVRLKRLYRSALENFYVLPNGTKVPKFVNLDMEEYRDLNLTVTLFKRVLDDAEFYQYSAGIVLQAYLPDAFLFQQELTVWAMQRVNNGGAPIKIRIVKGANLAMEQVESALKGWPQAPYHSKTLTDANYKRMLTYASETVRAKAVHIGVGSHNLFDIAFALLIRAENGIEEYMTFEMLEGMADPIRRVVQSLSGNMLLYCPAATSEEFQNAVAYLIRRLDENTAPENFLRHAFEMLPNTPQWQSQADLFSLACQNFNDVSSVPGRYQSRLIPPIRPSYDAPFENEADTDWALPQNIKWADMILRHWSEKKIDIIPIVVGGKEVISGLPLEKMSDPSYPEKELYRYVSAGTAELEDVLQTAEMAAKTWSEKSLSERLLLIDNAAHQLRCHRADLIGAMVADTAKTVPEADVEVSEAIDFATYYRRSMEELVSLEDIRWLPKGPVLVAPPWNFPCSIPVGGIIGALAAGNSVIFKPAPEAILVGWQLVNALWDSGIGKDVLQFFCCQDDPVGTSLIQDPRLTVVILTGATSTAKKFMKLRPGIDLIAETGGKNALIITNMSDRDLAIKDLLQSAFGHAGQKCSACSLAILQAEVYDDPHFRKQLLDAAESLKVGLPWDLSTKVNPLIRAPSPELLRALTTLEAGEEWLLQPKQNLENDNLWSPGIKLGVKAGSFTHQTELFGPVLGIMRAKSLRQAIAWANATPYGLTAGIHTLDEREQEFWSEHIIAGNCYINRTITGAIVRRQPFGGCKESSFGPGAKAGGPNYMLHLMRPQSTGLPLEREPVGPIAMQLNQVVQQKNFSEEELEGWVKSIGSYSFFWNHF